jgi:hypothetical protein
MQRIAAAAETITIKVAQSVRLKAVDDSGPTIGLPIFICGSLPNLLQGNCNIEYLGLLIQM